MTAILSPDTGPSQQPADDTSQNRLAGDFFMPPGEGEQPVTGLGFFATEYLRLHPELIGGSHQVYRGALGGAVTLDLTEAADGIFVWKRSCIAVPDSKGHHYWATETFVLGPDHFIHERTNLYDVAVPEFNMASGLQDPLARQAAYHLCQLLAGPAKQYRFSDETLYVSARPIDWREALARHAG